MYHMYWTVTCMLHMQCMDTAVTYVMCMWEYMFYFNFTIYIHLYKKQAKNLIFKSKCKGKACRTTFSYCDIKHF